jgi:hypothetical protein
MIGSPPVSGDPRWLFGALLFMGLSILLWLVLRYMK